jgi:hypothetical protein
MAGMVYAFMTADAVSLDGGEDEREELNGWIDQDWSMTVLHDSRNDVLPLVKEWESDTEELTDSVRDVLGDGSLWEDNGDGTFYAMDSREDDGFSFTYAVHFFVKDCINGAWCETPWHPEKDGGISLSE